MWAVHTLAGAVLGAGLGVQIFLAYQVAPAAFRLLDRPVAVRLMESVFPGYYTLGLVTAVLALALVAALAARERSPLRWGVAVLLAATLGGTAYAGQVLLPQAHAARLRAQAAPAGDLAPLAFSRLHRRAVAVNIAVFAVGALALGLHAATPPGGSGASARGESQGSAHKQPSHRESGP